MPVRSGAVDAPFATAFTSSTSSAPHSSRLIPPATRPASKSMSSGIFSKSRVLLAIFTTGATGEVITQTVGWPYAAADTTRTRLIWGSDTQIGTAETMFSLETYLTGLAW